MSQEITVFNEMTTIERNALTPSSGAVIINTDNKRWERYNGSSWDGLVPNGVFFKIRTVSDGDTILPSDYVLVVAGAGGSNLLLPQGVNGMEFIIKEIGGAFAVGFSAFSGDTVGNNGSSAGNIDVLGAQKITFKNGAWRFTGLYQGGI